MIDANDYKHKCRPNCDCPDRYDSIVAQEVRRIAGRALTLLQRSDPNEFAAVWEKRELRLKGSVRLVLYPYYFYCGQDRWLRVSRINVDNTPGQLTVFSAWLDERSNEGLNYSMADLEEIIALSAFLEQRLVLDDMARI